MALADISITGIALHGRHGALEAERSLGQKFALDLAIVADIGDAQRTDRLEDTLHYGQVVKAAVSAFNAKSLNLIEAAAGAVADELIARFDKIVSVRVTVHKPSAPIAAIIDDLAVTVERRR
ncbi:MAG TPA: dihydroneopterin aldolase [Bauldia sp.]|nr:dihydroneopterin aldolase [Bauldia sp.]